MWDIKLTRWAAYILPGSIVVFGLWLIGRELFGLKLTHVSTHLALCVYIFLGSSYVMGICLWNACHKWVERVVVGEGRKPMRVRLAQELLKEHPNYFAGFSRAMKAVWDDQFKWLDAKEHKHEFYEIAYYKVCKDAGSVNTERVMRDRETAGLLRLLLFAVTLMIPILAGLLARKVGLGWDSHLAIIVVSLLGPFIFLLLMPPSSAFQKRDEFDEIEKSNESKEPPPWLPPLLLLLLLLGFSVAIWGFAPNPEVQGSDAKYYHAGLILALFVLMALHFAYRCRNRTLVRDILVTFMATTPCGNVLERQGTEPSESAASDPANQAPDA